MCSYDEMVLKGMYPLNEYTKLPLLRGWTLHLPALRGIGLATVLVMLSLTSCTMASAALALIRCSACPSRSPPDWRTVTSVIVGSVGEGRGELALCWVFAATAAALV